MEENKDDGKISLLDLHGEDRYCVANIRGHKGFITTAMWSRNDSNHIMTCSDDQSIKIWNLVNIKHRKPPGKKKKESEMGQIIMEDDFDANEDQLEAKVNRYQNFKTGKKQ